MQRFCCVILIFLSSLVIASPIQAQIVIGGRQVPQQIDPNEQLSDEQLLQKLGIATDGPGLLNYFKERTYPETSPELMQKLIGELSDVRFAVREDAYNKIMKLGSGAMFSLKASRSVDDVEAMRRVNDLLEILEEKANPTVQSAVARMVAKFKPKDAASVLLNYVPFAADDSVQEEIANTLTILAKANPNGDPALSAALSDAKFPVKRRVAALAIINGQVKKDLPSAVNLLTDPDGSVRMTIALALCKQQDKNVRMKAIDTMVGTLDDVPADAVWEAENLLIQLAGDDTPQVSVGTTKEEQKNYQKSWQTWWDSNKAKIDVAKLDREDSIRGLITLVYQEPSQVVNGQFQQGGRTIAELDPNKKERWKFSVQSTYPVDAEVIGKDRVLVAEFNGRCITERDFKGTVKWRYSLNNYPISAHHLKNGNTFVVLRNQMLELDRDRKVVFDYTRPGYDIFRAVKLRNGNIVFLTSNGLLNFMDPRTKNIIKSFNVGNPGTYYGGMDVLQNGNILVPLFSNNQVVEYTPAGNAVWRTNMQWPTTAVRLPNGNTLVGSLNTRQMVEVDRQGRQVWSHTYPGQIYQVRLR